MIYVCVMIVCMSVHKNTETDGKQHTTSCIKTKAIAIASAAIYPVFVVVFIVNSVIRTETLRVWSTVCIEGVLSVSSSISSIYREGCCMH